MSRAVRNGTRILFAAFVIGAALALQPNSNADRSGSPSEDSRRKEETRVREHLAGAEQLLLRADTAHLTIEQRAARVRNIARLRQYRDRGLFPRNLDYPGERRPYFVDDRGVPCAMAYLVAGSGRTDLVDRIRATRNNAWIRDLAADPDLVAWLSDSGLTAAEAARIQPSYDYEPSPSRISATYAIASAGGSLASGAAMIWSLSGDAHASRWRGAPAIVAGAYSFALGASKLDDDGDVQKLGIWNTALGALSLGIGARTLLRHTGNADVASFIEPSGIGHATFSVAPMFASTPGLQLLVSF